MTDTFVILKNGELTISSNTGIRKYKTKEKAIEWAKYFASYGHNHEATFEVGKLAVIDREVIEKGY
jgi:hypothetical protein